MSISDGEKLETAVNVTIQFCFGTICDRVESQLLSDRKDAEIVAFKLAEMRLISFEHVAEVARQIEKKRLESAQNDVRILKREARNQGNSAIRTIANHMQHYHIRRRHKADNINVERVAKTYERRQENGD